MICISNHWTSKKIIWQLTNERCFTTVMHFSGFNLQHKWQLRLKSPFQVCFGAEFHFIGVWLNFALLDELPEIINLLIGRRTATLKSSVNRWANFHFLAHSILRGSNLNYKSELTVKKCAHLNRIKWKLQRLTFCKKMNQI